HSQVYALSAADGTTRWHTLLIGCPGYQPLLAGSLLYIAASGHDCAASGWINALRASDGSVVWRTPIERAVLLTLGLTDGTLLVISPPYPAFDEQQFLPAARAREGARLWRVRLSLSAYSLAAADGVAIVSGDFS